MPAMSLLLTDLGLARRLERAEGDANRRFVEARARVDPGVGAAWVAVDGTYAMFDGVDSPLTQTFGLGLFAPVTGDQLDRLEAFFGDRGAATCHEVSPLADGALPLLFARGYEAFECSSVMFRELDSVAVSPASSTSPGSPQWQVRRIDAADLPRFNELAADGWGDYPELREFLLGFGRVTSAAEGMWSFIAELDGQPGATASMILHDGVALLAGASTIPSARRRGAQAALLAARLAVAREQGCTVGMMVAQAGSGSQRNAERNGFRIAYTRYKWRLPLRR